MISGRMKKITTEVASGGGKSCLGRKGFPGMIEIFWSYKR
jgi:hypothetical protein